MRQGASRLTRITARIAPQQTGLLDQARERILTSPVPVSAYDAFLSLKQLGKLGGASIEEWNAIIGLRNRIVPGYMNIDMALVLGLVREQRYRIVTEFLMQPPSPLAGHATLSCPRLKSRSSSHC